MTSSPIFSIFWTYVYLTTSTLIASSSKYETDGRRSLKYESAVRSSTELSCYSEDLFAPMGRMPFIRNTRHLRSTCKDDSPSEAKDKCISADRPLNTYGIVPVTDKESNVSYNNVYCALCNNVDPDHVVFWFLWLKCSVTANVAKDNLDLDHDIPDIVAGESCETIFESPNHVLLFSLFAEECYFPVEECNVTGAWTLFDATVNRDCVGPAFNPLIWKGIVFENVDCATCNDIQGPEVHGGYRRYDAFPRWSYSAWLDVSYDIFLATVNRTSQDGNCVPGPLSRENNEQSQCIETRCSPLRHKLGSKCEKRYHLLQHYTYRICLRLRPKASLTLKEAVHAWSHLHPALVSALIAGFLYNEYKYEVIFFSKHDSANNSVPDRETLLQTEFLYYDWRMKLLVELDPEENLNSLLPFVESDDLVIPTEYDTFVFDATLKDYVNEEHRLVKLETRYVAQNPWKWSEAIDLDLAQVITSSTPRIALGFEEYDSTSKPFYSGPISAERNILEMRDCMFVKVTTNESLWIETDFELRFPQSGTRLTYLDFVYGDSDDVIWMCEEMYLKMFAGRLQDTNNVVRDVQSSAHVVAFVTYNTVFVLLFCMIY